MKRTVLPGISRSPEVFVVGIVYICAKGSTFAINRLSPYQLGSWLTFFRGCSINSCLTSVNTLVARICGARICGLSFISCVFLMAARPKTSRSIDLLKHLGSVPWNLPIPALQWLDITRPLFCFSGPGRVVEV